MKRVLKAAPPLAFAAFSDSSALAKWFGPKGFTIPSLQFQPRVGNSYRIEMQPPSGDPFWLTGEFRDVLTPARLSYTFVWEDPAPDDVETLVVLSFRDLGGSTDVSFSQGPFKTARAVRFTGKAGRTASTNSSGSSPRRHSEPSRETARVCRNPAAASRGPHQ